MRKRELEKRFKPEFWKELPTTPGVYRIYSVDNEIIYVGKAKNLRRRLAQYRHATRKKAHHKMRAIMTVAMTIQVQACATDQEALLLELREIQKHKPLFNVASAFHFMYPFIGIKREGKDTTLLITSKPEAFEGYEWHGTFRLRSPTRYAFNGLLRMFSYMYQYRHMQLHRSLHSRGGTLYNFDEKWLDELRNFLLGESPTLMENLLLALTANPRARARAKRVQHYFECLDEFWRLEAQTFRLLRMRANFTTYPVPQTERDTLRILARQREALAQI